MALAHWIDNYPGFVQGIDGASLAQAMERQAARFGVQTVTAQVLSAELRETPKRLQTDGGEFLARAVVLATGADPRLLGLSREAALKGRGVHYCAACDGWFYSGKTVVVVGGGSTAASDVLLLSSVARRVILVHRRSALACEAVSREALRKTPNVEFRWNTVLTGLLGEETLTGVRIRNVCSGEQTVLSCDGVFVAIGRQPASGLARGQVELDEGGYLVAGEDTRTSLPGVYAVGDVRTKVLRQIVTATADGAMAAHMAGEYLAQQTK